MKEISSYHGRAVGAQGIEEETASTTFDANALFDDFEDIDE